MCYNQYIAWTIRFAIHSFRVKLLADFGDQCIESLANLLWALAAWTAIPPNIPVALTIVCALFADVFRGQTFIVSVIPFANGLYRDNQYSTSLSTTQIS